MNASMVCPIPSLLGIEIKTTKYKIAVAMEQEFKNKTRYLDTGKNGLLC
jgi:hypothetical protein